MAMRFSTLALPTASRLSYTICVTYIVIVSLLYILRSNDLVGNNDPEEFCSSAFHLYNIKLIRSIVFARFAPLDVATGLVELWLLFVFVSAIGSSAVTKKTAKIYGAAYILSLAALVGVAGIFSLYAGYNMPMFYWASTLNDCSHGLTPLFWLLLPFYLGLNTSEPMISSMRTCRFLPTFSGSFWTIVAMLILIMLDNQQIWLSLISLVVGSFTFHFFVVDQHELPSQDPAGQAENASGKYRSTQPSRIPISKYFIIFFILCAVGLSSKRVWYRYTDVCRTDPLSSLQDELWEDEAFIDIVIPTVPRPTGATFLIETLGTYVQTLPVMPSDPLWGRVRVHVINQSRGTSHPVFEAAKTLFGPMNSTIFFHDRVEEFFSTPYVPDGFPLEVKYHVHPDWSAVLWKGLQLGGRYIMLADDDYEICPRGWRNMLTTMCYAKQRSRGPCGYWFGFGSHMMFDRKMTDKIIKVLIDEIVLKPKKNYLGTDEVIGLCLEGNHPRCLECLADSAMMAPTRLLFRHIGFWSARVNQDQRSLLGTNDCTWRNPTNFPWHNALMVQVDH